MPLFRFLFRCLIVVVGAVVGLAFFLFAVVAFVTILLLSLLTGRKPNMQFRMNRSPWAQRRPQAPVDGDIVDIEAREVKAPAAEPLPLQPPRY